MAAIDLDKEQWQQLKAVLTQALKLSSSERVQLLDRALAHSPILREHAVEMLQYYDKATRPFDLTEADTQPAGGHSERMQSMALEAGEAIGPYRVLRKLGEGGMGVVYLAEDQRLGRLVALKFLAPSLRRTRTDSNGQLMAEARSAAVLNHPGIVTLHDVLEVRGEIVAVMEYVEGRPLSELIAGEPLALGFALRLAGQLADALAYAHGRGIIHCDLKPANVHVLANGSAKILDFGLARAVTRPEGEPNALEGRLFGTPGYLSPERLLGRESTAASDVYALGVVLYQLLTGMPPFRTDDDAQLFLDTLTATPLPPSTLVVGIPAAVDDLALRCLSKNPRERLQPHELLRALNDVLLEMETAPIPYASIAGRRRAVPARTPGPRPAGVEVTPRGWWQDRAVAGGWAVVALAGGLSFVGFITSISYNQPLGLIGSFANESALWWPVWGLRSLVAVVGGIVLLSLLLVAVTGAGRLAFAAIGPLRRWCAPLFRSADRLSKLVRGTPNAVIAPALLLLQIIAVGFLLWRFQSIISGIDSFIMKRLPSDLWALRPQNRQEHRLLSETLIVELLVFGLAWYWILRRGRERNEQDASVVVWSGAAIMAFSLLFFEVAPFRILYHNEAERVSYQSSPCYLVGEHDNEELLFCPRRPPPWGQIVKSDDPALKREGTFESIFAGFDDQH
jgi:predicted Ser/Thr protein kinase